MVARAGRYYSALSKGCRGVTQGDPMSPTILNMVVDTVIYHWAKVVTREEGGPERFGRVVLVTGEDAGTEGFGRAVQNLAVLFYVDDGLLYSPWLARLQ